MSYEELMRIGRAMMATRQGSEMTKVAIKMRATYIGNSAMGNPIARFVVSYPESSRADEEIVVTQDCELSLTVHLNEGWRLGGLVKEEPE